MVGEGKRLDPFWDELDELLGAIPLDLSLEEDTFYSQPEWTVYRVWYYGMGEYRLFSWLSVPRRPGPFPALLRMPDYGSVHDLVHTLLRHDAVVMNPTYRGQRGSDSPFEASYPGLLTQGIDRPGTYVIRQVFADGLRAVDALLSQGLAEITTLALTGAGLGASLGLAAAARRPAVRALAVDTPLALGHPRMLEEAAAYPLGEMHDYLRIYPHRRDEIMEGCSPLDPVRMAAAVDVPTLLSLGTRDRGQCPLSIGEEIAAQIADCDLRVYDGAGEGGGHPHGVVRAAWLRERLGLA